PLPTNEAAIKFWKDRLEEAKDPYVTNHYAILYDPTTTAAELQSYATRLEEAFHGFYYWFALKGKALPVPRKRLTVVLLSQPGNFDKWYTAFEGPQLVSDGFYSRRDDILVFSGTRLDGPYTTFAAFAQNQFWQKKWNRQALLKGQGQLLGSTPA